jgi:hypothetical protein
VGEMSIKGEILLMTWRSYFVCKNSPKMINDPYIPPISEENHQVQQYWKA